MVFFLSSSVEQKSFVFCPLFASSGLFFRSSTLPMTDGITHRFSTQ